MPEVRLLVQKRKNFASLEFDFFSSLAQVIFQNTTVGKEDKLAPNFLSIRKI